MRRLTTSSIALVLLIAMAACDPITVETTTTLDALPPPDLPGPSSSTTTTASPPVSNDPSPYTYRGFLPNGADYEATLPGSREQVPLLIQGVFHFQGDDGLIPVGEVRYARVSEPELGSYESRVLRVAGGEWVVDVVFLEQVIEELGANAEEVVTASIGLEDREGWPVLQLSPPFTWGSFSSVAPSVQYESFAIAAGCDALSVTCAESRSVQIQALADIAPGYPALTSEQRDHAWVTTSTRRYVHDPNYLDPGPLDPRLSADLIWTGEEMIVWGGKQARDGLNTLVDGAAFNPETNEWRMIAPFPLQGPQASRAVWGEGEMLVVSSEGTFGYDPETDIWREIGQALVPPEFEDRMLYLDGWVYVWDRAFSMHRMEVGPGMWETVGAPDELAGFTEGWAGVLRVLDGEVVAVTVRDGCEGRQVWRLSGNEWEGLPEVTLATETYADCSAANQAATATGEIVIWATETHPSATYSFENEAWRELPPVPLSGTEGASGPVPMGTDHFLVPQWGDGAIFDATTEEWTRVTLPGQGTDAEMIWTGEEILAWGIWGTFDAWRWTPGQMVSGGDDAS